MEGLLGKYNGGFLGYCTLFPAAVKGNAEQNESLHVMKLYMQKDIRGYHLSCLIYVVLQFAVLWLPLTLNAMRILLATVTIGCVAVCFFCLACLVFLDFTFLA